MEGVASNWTAVEAQGPLPEGGRVMVVHAQVDPAHAEFLRRHAGHEALHARLAMGLLVFLVVAQAGLVLWKQRSPRSFELISLLGMLILPPLYAIWHHYWRFMTIWTAFVIVSAYFLSLPFREKPMHTSTPRRVYWFFFLSNKVAFGVALLGYLLILLDVMTGRVWRLGHVALLLLFYGLMYGVIARDLASLCADKMARALGYGASASSARSADAGLPDRLAGARVCAICADSLTSATEEIITLPTCGHDFHSFCIRGWRIVGKSECPRCREKVALSDVFVQPWEKQSVVWR